MHQGGIDYDRHVSTENQCVPDALIKNACNP